MGFISKFFEKRRQARLDRINARQSGRTDRTGLRTGARETKFQTGYQSNWGSQLGQGLAPVASGLSSIYGFGGLMGSGNASGTIRTGTDSSTGLVPIVIAVGAVIFAVLSFGGLFSKKRKR